MWYFAYGSNMQSDTLHGRRGIVFRRAMAVRAPGWRVTVDGEERPLLRANYLFRAVAVEPGQHTVEFRYAPGSIRVGAALSLATAAALTVFFVRRRRA